MKSSWSFQAYLLSGINGLFVSGMTLILPFLPLYVQRMGVDDPAAISLWTGLIFSANFVMQLVTQPLWGRLADRYGRKAMLIRSGLGAALFMTLMCWATEPWHLLMLRLGMGAVAGVQPAATALMSVLAPKERGGYAMGMLQSGAMIGSIAGPLIGGALAGWLGYENVFLVTGAIQLLATLAIAVYIREPFDRQSARSAPRASMAEDWRKLMRVSQLFPLYGTTFVIQFATYALIPVVPLFLLKLYGEQHEQLALYAGLVTSVSAFTQMIAASLLGRLADKIGPERVLTACLFGLALTVAPQGWAGSVGELLPLRLAMGVFIAGLAPSVGALIQRHAPAGMEGSAFGFNTSAFALGMLTGPATAGLMVGWGGVVGAFWLAAGMSAAGGVWTAALRTKLRQRPETSAPSL